MMEEGGVVVTNYQFLMLSPNLLKSQIPYMMEEGGIGDQLPTFDAEKIQNSLFSVDGLVTNFQCLMLSPNLLKSQILYTVEGW